MNALRRACVLLAVSVVTTLGALGQDAPIKHRVQPGDTVARLSWQYKIRSDAIRALNGLKGDTLTPGTTILIPPTSDYVVPASRGEPDTIRIAPRVTPPANQSAPRETTTTQDLRAPAKKANPPTPRDEPDAMPTPYVQDRSERPVQKRKTTPTPRATEPSNVPRDEPPLEEIVRPTPSPKAKMTSAVAVPPPDAPVMRSRRDPDFLTLARQLADKGIPYNGGWTPPGESASWVMDCSNTCRWLYREGAGIELPRTASDQYVTLDRAGLLWPAPTGFLSSRVNTDKLGRRLKPGDLLFWENTYKPVRRPDITHVMLYLGTDAQGRWRMVGSQTTHGVNIYDFDPTKAKGGYRTFFGLFKHEGRFVAFGRPLGKT
jgi:LysM repeat protein